MSNQPRIPLKETRAHHIAKLRELNIRMEQHIMLNELNAFLEANLRAHHQRIY